MGSLIDNIRDKLRSEKVQSELGLLDKAYRNDGTLYRSKNRRPRTDLMVKGLSGSSDHL